MGRFSVTLPGDPRPPCCRPGDCCSRDYHPAGSSYRCRPAAAGSHPVDAGSLRDSCHDADTGRCHILPENI